MLTVMAINLLVNLVSSLSSGCLSIFVTCALLKESSMSIFLSMLYACVIALKKLVSNAKQRQLIELQYVVANKLMSSLIALFPISRSS
jgi:hypothetical protein